MFLLVAPFHRASLPPVPQRETPLSRRTSRVKSLRVTRSLGDRAAGSDGACAEHEVALPELRGGSGGRASAACVLNCPRLNCTRAIELCYTSAACVAVDISFGVAGRDAVARLRYGRG